MGSNGRIGISGLDTRALTHLVRREGPPTIAFAHNADGKFDLEALQKSAAEWPGLEGMDLAADVSRTQLENWTGGKWVWGRGYRSRAGTTMPQCPHVVAIDYGAKRNIFRNLVEAGARVTVLPATATFDEVMGHQPDGFFLSNGPGDPAATARICRAGDQADDRQRQAPVRHLPRPPIARAGGRREDQQDVPGPPRRQPSGQAAAPTAASRSPAMNHGFAVMREGLPANARETHVSLFDGSNCGFELTDSRCFRCNTTPKRARGRRTAFICSRSSSGRCASAAQRQLHLGARSRRGSSFPLRLRDPADAFKQELSAVEMSAGSRWAS